MKNKVDYIDIDFIEQDTGSIIFHRRKPIDIHNNVTYRKMFQELTDSLVRSLEKGDYSLLISVSRPVRQMKTLFSDVP